MMENMSERRPQLGSSIMRTKQFLGDHIVDPLRKLDARVSNWSTERDRQSRQQRLDKLMKQTTKELSADQPSLELLKSYVDVRRRYRDLLPTLHQQGASGNSRWAELGGNDVETEYHKLATQLRNDHPELKTMLDKINSLI